MGHQITACFGTGTRSMQKHYVIGIVSFAFLARDSSPLFCGNNLYIGGGTYSADTAIAVPLLKVVRLIM